MRPGDVHPSHDVREEGYLVSDPVCQICRASVHGSPYRLLNECPGAVKESLTPDVCPTCGALPCDWVNVPAKDAQEPKP